MYPLPTKIDVPMIKGILPNFITARATIAQLKRDEETAAAKEKRAVRPVIYCQFCGRGPFDNLQSLRAHFGHCRGKAALAVAFRDGIKYAVGTSSFVVRCKTIKLHRHLERLEEVLSRKVSEGLDPDDAANGFIWILEGAAAATPDGAVSVEERDAPVTASLPPYPSQMAAGVG